jgi:hypothetical protein
MQGVRYPVFSFCLRKAREFDREYPHMQQVRWLLENFRCDDQAAVYEPRPIEIGPATLWWLEHARN